MFRQCSFDATKNKLDCYRGKDCVKMFLKDLKKHATKIINYRKRKTIPLTYAEKKFIKSKKLFIYAKKDLVLMMIIKIIIKSEIIAIILEIIEKLLMYL